jgi:hypothetical protein
MLNCQKERIKPKRSYTQTRCFANQDVEFLDHYFIDKLPQPSKFPPDLPAKREPGHFFLHFQYCQNTIYPIKNTEFTSPTSTSPHQITNQYCPHPHQPSTPSSPLPASSPSSSSHQHPTSYPTSQTALRHSPPS